jgi:hypothetical protein
MRKGPAEGRRGRRKWTWKIGKAFIIIDIDSLYTSL